MCPCCLCLKRKRGIFSASLQIGGEDTNITFEDQQQINTFARKSARIQELKDEIEEKKVCIELIEV